MTLFIWKENFNLNIPEIDEQHQGFLDYLNNLHDALETKYDETAIARIFRAISLYTVVHLHGEEELMASVNYPGLDEQRKQHLYFAFQMESLREMLHSQSSASLRAIEFLRDWFIHHILEQDKKFGEYYLQTRPDANMPSHQAGAGGQ